MRPIVIEGADCVGKTTLINKLRKELNYMGAHCGPPPAQWTTECFLSFLHPGVVFDRLFPSSYVYDRVRGYDQPAISDEEELKSLFAQARTECTMRPIFVVLVCEEEVLRERLKVRGDGIFSTEEIVLANELFISIAGMFDYVIKLGHKQEYPDGYDAATICVLAQSKAFL
jgi:thymidylate kinase